jgi:hypothetical protein
MSDKPDDGGPAFPSHPDSAYAGMTLRDWFAGMALQGMIAAHWTERYDYDSYSDCAYSMADSMIAMRDSK